MSEPTSSPERGLTPFAWFAIALVVGAAFAIYMGLSYEALPNFTTADLPTIAGITIAVVAFLVIGARAPPNE
jgi:prolipoprotein diacylglyceryltransferase